MSGQDLPDYFINHLKDRKIISEKDLTIIPVLSCLSKNKISQDNIRNFKENTFGFTP